MSKTKNTEKHLREVMAKEQATQAEAGEEMENGQKFMNFTPKDGPHTPQEAALYDKAVFTWMAPEYIQHPKSNIWYMAAAIVAGIVVVLDVITGNYTMAVAVLVFMAVYYYIHLKHPPKNIKITISRMGIKVGNMVFPFSSIQAFWIFYHPPHLTTLNLRVKEHFFSEVIIQLNHEDPVPIREFLCGQIPEWEGKSERLGDVILRLLKL